MRTLDDGDRVEAERIRYLKRQCRLTWQRASRGAPESFEAWLRSFEACVERIREQRMREESNPEGKNQGTNNE